MIRSKAVLFLSCACVALGCATSDSGRPMHTEPLPGKWHLVQPGETSASIARRMGIPLEDFLEINGLQAHEALAPGRPVFLLDGVRGPVEPEPASMVSAPAPTPHVEPSPAVAPVSPSPPTTSASAPLRWPLSAPRVSSRFGTRWGKPHEGIDMGAPIGTPVFAAAPGKVVYAGDQVRGYGNMVVLGHPAGLVTVYAHNSVLMVRTGDRVSLGQEIARVGDTGRSTGPHLHFEVRRGDHAQDPMQFLPALK